MNHERIFNADGIDQRGWHRDARTRWYSAVSWEGEVVGIDEQYHNPPFETGGFDPDNGFAPAWGFGDTPEESIANARGHLPAPCE